MSIIVNEIKWVGSKGEVCIEGYVDGKEKDSKKSLIFINENKKYFIPIQSKYELDDSISFNYYKFKACVDLSYLDNKDSLSPGEWNLKVGTVIEDKYMEQNLISDKKLLIPDGREFANKSNRCYVKINFLMRDDQIYIVSAVNGNINDNILSNWIKKSSEIVKTHIKFIKSVVIRNLYSIFKKMPLSDKKIIFLSDSRENMSGNFRYVYEEIMMRSNNYKIKFFLNASIMSKVSLMRKIDFLYSVATSKYILLDDYYPKIYKFNLRKETELVQLWHACGAFKTFGFSRLGKVGGPKLRSANHRNYTKAIVSSSDVRKYYAEGFGISEDKVYATGIPRTDIFFDEKYKQNIRSLLIEKYKSLQNKKVIMFAPTFRGNGQSTAYYDFNKLDIDRLHKELGDEYIIIVKMHPFVNEKFPIKKEFKDFILDLSDEREVNDLLFISDILITDYSSVCFEFSLLNRPMIFFAYDKEEYISKRDFYYPYDSFVPGPIAKSTEDIIRIINNEDFEMDKLERFRNKFFDHFDGKSTKRVVDLILNEEGKSV